VDIIIVYLAANGEVAEDTKYPGRVRTDKRPWPGALAFTSMVR
jgi:hypothetical protein